MSYRMVRRQFSYTQNHNPTKPTTSSRARSGPNKPRWYRRQGWIWKWAPQTTPQVFQIPSNAVGSIRSKWYRIGGRLEEGLQHNGKSAMMPGNEQSNSNVTHTAVLWAAGWMQRTQLSEWWKAKQSVFNAGHVGRNRWAEQANICQRQRTFGSSKRSRSNDVDKYWLQKKETRIASH